MSSYFQDDIRESEMRSLFNLREVSGRSETDAILELEDGYSKEKMLEIYRDRVRYLIERGSTLNNPHIPGSYFNNWDTVIRDDHASNLRNFVKSHFLDKLP